MQKPQYVTGQSLGKKIRISLKDKTKQIFHNRINKDTLNHVHMKKYYFYMLLNCLATNLMQFKLNFRLVQNQIRLDQICTYRSIKVGFSWLLDSYQGKQIQMRFAFSRVQTSVSQPLVGGAPDNDISGRDLVLRPRPMLKFT